MSASDLLSSTLNWPGKGLYGLKSSVLQTTETNLVKQRIVSDHMKHHYRRLNSARSAVDSKPPKAMILGQKCRDRAKKEMAQMAYTQDVLNQYSARNPGSVQATPRGRSSHSARSQRFAQSQPTTFRARSRSIESSRRITRSLTMNGADNEDIAAKLLGGGAISQALTTMAALGKLTSSERNRQSADVLDKHSDFFSEPAKHQPRLVKRDGDSCLKNNRTHYNPPSRRKARPSSASKNTSKIGNETLNETKPEDDEQLALSIRRVREQLNRSLELRNNVEKKIKKAKTTPMSNFALKKQSDATLRQFGLSEQERLQYVRFMQEITDAILRKNLTTEAAIEKLFEIHIDRNREILDERRLRDLLEALKEDLGVRTSRKANGYASIDRATTFDKNPLPPPVPSSARDESILLTPTTPYDEKRRLSYDIETPLPWQAETESSRKPSVTPRLSQTPKGDAISDRPIDSFDDDHLFRTTIKPKPRTTLQSKPMDESDSAVPMNFNGTIRKPIVDLHNTDWLQDAPTSNAILEEKPSLENNHQETIEEQASPSGSFQPRPDESEYDGDEFENDEDDSDR